MMSSLLSLCCHTLAAVATVPTLARQAAVRISFVGAEWAGSHCHGMSCVSAQPAIADTAIASSSAWMEGGKSVLGDSFIGCVARLNETCESRCRGLSSNGKADLHKLILTPRQTPAVRGSRSGLSSPHAIKSTVDTRMQSAWPRTSPYINLSGDGFIGYSVLNGFLE